MHLFTLHLFISPSLLLPSSTSHHFYLISSPIFLIPFTAAMYVHMMVHFSVREHLVISTSTSLREKPSGRLSWFLSMACRRFLPCRFGRLGWLSWLVWAQKSKQGERRTDITILPVYSSYLFSVISWPENFYLSLLSLHLPRTPAAWRYSWMT